MRVSVDTGLCCGSGSCVLSAPEVFDQDDDNGLVVLLAEQPPEHQWEAVEEALECCPTGAISVS